MDIKKGKPNPLGKISDCSKVARYKINIQKLYIYIVAMCIWYQNLKHNIIYNLPKNEMGKNLPKLVQYLYLE